MGKKDCVADPYEFNAKVEDDVLLPVKKVKMEKNEMLCIGSKTLHNNRQDSCTETADVAIATDPDLLGPCEPGTSVTLEGIVWHESENGVLVVNVTWRDKTYVGTLLDATRHDWAPPRFICESPSIELDIRTPKGRGKRRTATSTPVQDARTLRKGCRGSSVSTFTAPPSPAKSESSVGSGVKRKGRPQDVELALVEYRCSKRSRSGSQVSSPNSKVALNDNSGFFECPEPHCNKKYKNVNGLRYHKSHAHSNFLNDDEKDEMVEFKDIPLGIMTKELMERNENKNLSSSNDNFKVNKCASDNLNDVSNTDDVNKNDVSDIIGKKRDGDYANINEQLVDCNSLSKDNISSRCLNLTPTCSSHFSENNVTSALLMPASGSCLSLVSDSLSREINDSVTQGKIFVSKSKQDLNIPVTELEDSVKLNKKDRAITCAQSHVELSSMQKSHSSTPVLSFPQVSTPDNRVQKRPMALTPCQADVKKEPKGVKKKKPNNSVQHATLQTNPNQNETERTGVIKTNHLQKSGIRNGNISNEIDNVSSSCKSISKICDHLSSQTQYDSSVYSSPQSVKRPDDACVSDDVQSPAYSDISDANDSTSPAVPSESSHPKLKEETHPCKKNEHGRPDTPPLSESQMLQHYGIYTYYKPSSLRQSSYESDQKSPQPSSTSYNTSLPHNIKQETNMCNASSDEPMNKEPKKDDVSVHEKSGCQPKESHYPSQVNSDSVSCSMTPDHQNYQVMYPHSMYIQSVPQHCQHQYGPNGWYQSAVDQNFLSKVIDKQNQSHGEHYTTDGDTTPGNKQTLCSELGNKNMQDDVCVLESFVSPSQKTISNSVNPAKDGIIKDQTLMEKQGENCQNLQENIINKNEMEKKQAEDIRRFKMYQEQKLIEERKKDLARKSEVYKLESVSSKVPGTKPINNKIARNLTMTHKSSTEMVQDGNNTKREHALCENHTESKDLSRPCEVKVKTSVEKHNAESPIRSSDKKLSSCVSSLSCSPCSTACSSSISDSPGFSSYSNYVSYLQNPHSYLGIEPSHPMYRDSNINPVLFGSAYASNQYIRSQIGYGRNSDHNENEGKDGSMHKIHELSEKVLPKSRNSPGPQKPNNLDINCSMYDKQRDFCKSPPTQRHVHTHHHTHVLQPGPALPPGAQMQGPPGYCPVYDPYNVSALFVSQSQSPHQFQPK